MKSFLSQPTAMYFYADTPPTVVKSLPDTSKHARIARLLSRYEGISSPLYQKLALVQTSDFMG